MSDRKQRLIRSQGSPAEKKIAFIRARLDHFRIERKDIRNADDFVRQKRLFECVFHIHHSKPYPLSPPQISRGDKRQAGASV